jgi:Uma2 family endonuclease
MATATLDTLTSTPVKIGETRVIFHHLNWEKYQQILNALGEQRSARLTYDRGNLEITMPLEEHENAKELIGLFIRIIVVEMGMKIKSMGSTTMSYPDLDKSAEPDQAYYIKNQDKVAGKKVDFAEDPPPDLVLEVDIIHTDIDKLKFYASIGVPEFWRYNGRVLRIYQLQDQQYQEVENSPTFPGIAKAEFYRFMNECQQDEAQAEKSFRVFVQEMLKNPHN